MVAPKWYNLCNPGWNLVPWKKEKISEIRSELKVLVDTGLWWLYVVGKTEEGVLNIWKSSLSPKWGIIDFISSKKLVWLTRFSFLFMYSSELQLTKPLKLFFFFFFEVPHPTLKKIYPKRFFQNLSDVCRI